jgi:hypothetical protein
MNKFTVGDYIILNELSGDMAGSIGMIFDIIGPVVGVTVQSEETGEQVERFLDEIEVEHLPVDRTILLNDILNQIKILNEYPFIDAETILFPEFEAIRATFRIGDEEDLVLASYYSEQKEVEAETMVDGFVKLIDMMLMLLEMTEMAEETFQKMMND